MSKTHYIPFIVLSILLTFSCKKEPVPEQKIKIPGSDTLMHQNLYVLNEGNFQWNNADVTLYNMNTGEITDNYYHFMNQKHLGDVLQSAYVDGNNTYLIVNNAQKIEVIETNTGKHIYTLTGFTSPRYFLKINDQKAYVSDLYAHGIWVVDLQNQQIIQKISCTGWTEQMVLLNNEAYITNKHQKYVYVIDINNDKITDSIEVAYGANSLQIDSQNNIWVLCAGDAALNEPGGICKISPSEQKTVLQIPVSNSVYASKLTMDKNKKHLYYLQKNVYKLNLVTTSTEPEMIISGSEKNFYGLAIHPDKNLFFIADVHDYVQKSTIEIYQEDFKKITEFKAGIISTDFVFF